MRLDFVSNRDKLFNPLFYNIKNADKRFVINYGGSGSGKSYAQHQWELINLMRPSRHDTLLLRKYASDLEHSTFKLLKELISQWEISHLFNIVFSNAKREITFIPNGRKLVFKGLDDPEKLKSISGFNRIIVEEASQITRDDFLELNRRVRGVANIQIVMLFNPIDERHWIKEHFFDTPIITDNTEIFHTTYRDNKFLTDEDREQLESLQAIKPNDYRIYTLGQWGKADVQRPYVHNFSRDKHVNALAKRQDNRPIIISLDFNLDPFVCVMAHQWHDGRTEHLHFFKEIVIKNGDIQTMAMRIKDSLTAIQLVNALFTGDATGRNRNISQQDAASNWKLLQRLLSISDNRLKLPRSNPSVSGSRNLINLVFATHPDLLFTPEMSLTINELLYTEADEEGNILKKDRSKMEQRADALDCVRYLIQNFYSDWERRMPFIGKK